MAILFKIAPTYSLCKPSLKQPFSVGSPSWPPIGPISFTKTDQCSILVKGMGGYETEIFFENRTWNPDQNSGHPADPAGRRGTTATCPHTCSPSHTHRCTRMTLNTPRLSSFGGKKKNARFQHFSVKLVPLPQLLLLCLRWFSIKFYFDNKMIIVMIWYDDKHVQVVFWKALSTMETRVPDMIYKARKYEVHTCLKKVQAQACFLRGEDDQ